MEIMESVMAFESNFETAGGKNVKQDGSVQLPQCLTSSELHTAAANKYGPVFWPVSVLSRKHVCHDASSLISIPGEAERGIFRDRDCGTPTGTIELSDEVARQLQSSLEL